MVDQTCVVGSERNLLVKDIFNTYVDGVNTFAVNPYFNKVMDNSNLLNNHVFILQPSKTS